MNKRNIRNCARTAVVDVYFVQIFAWSIVFLFSKNNIMASALEMMERRATNLESIVEERTQKLSEEKKKTDNLLYRMLPQYADQSLNID